MACTALEAGACAPASPQGGELTYSPPLVTRFTHEQGMEALLLMHLANWAPPFVHNRQGPLDEVYSNDYTIHAQRDDAKLLLNLGKGRPPTGRKPRKVKPLSKKDAMHSKRLEATRWAKEQMEQPLKQLVEKSLTTCVDERMCTILGGVIRVVPDMQYRFMNQLIADYFTNCTEFTEQEREIIVSHVSSKQGHTGTKFEPGRMFRGESYNASNDKLTARFRKYLQDTKVQPCTTRPRGQYAWECSELWTAPKDFGGNQV